MAKKTVDADDISDMLNEQHFGDSTSIDESNKDPLDVTTMILSVEKVKLYDKNPRKQLNSEYKSIKLSMLKRGVTGDMEITRRPGDDTFMVKAGWNTRLTIIHELNMESPEDRRFATIRCVFTPWVSEQEILVAHLIENDVRAPLIFIDRAVAIRNFQNIYEETNSTKLSTRQLSEVLVEEGYQKAPYQLISIYNFTVDFLLPYIPYVLQAGMGRPAIRNIKKLHVSITKLIQWKQRDELIGSVEIKFQQIMAIHDVDDIDEAFDLNHVELEIIRHLSDVLDYSVDAIKMDIESLKRGREPGPDAKEGALIPPRGTKTPNEAKTSLPSKTMASSDLQKIGSQNNKAPVADDNLDLFVNGDNSETKVIAQPNDGSAPQPDPFANQFFLNNEKTKKSTVGTEPSHSLEGATGDVIKIERNKIYQFALNIAEVFDLEDWVEYIDAGNGFFMELPKNSIQELFSKPDQELIRIQEIVYLTLGSISEFFILNRGLVPKHNYRLLPEYTNIYQYNYIMKNFTATKNDDGSHHCETLMPDGSVSNQDPYDPIKFHFDDFSMYPMNQFSQLFSYFNEDMFSTFLLLQQSVFNLKRTATNIGYDLWEGETNEQQ